MDACRGCLLLLATAVQLAYCGQDGMFLNQEAFLARNIRNTTIKLAQSVQVSCLSDGIEVDISREEVMLIGVVYPEQVQLADKDCHSTSSPDKFTLRTGFLDCGTEFSFSDDRSLAIMTNKVVVVPSYKFLDYSQDEENPYAGSKAEISFTCTYDHSTAAEEDQTQAATSTISKSVEITTQSATTTPTPQLPPQIKSADIKIYTTDSYLSPLDVTSTRITRGTSLYVQVDAWESKGSSMTTLIDSCYMSLEDKVVDTYDPYYGYYLIKDGCEYDRDAQFKGDNPKRFIFRAKRTNGNKPVYLHCSLRPCSATFGEECLSQEKYCEQRQKGDNPGTPANGYHAIYSEPLTVIKRQPVTPKPTTQVKPVKLNPTESPEKPSGRMLPKSESCPPTVQISSCKCPPVSEQQTSEESTQSSRHEATLVPMEVTIVVGVISFCIGAALVGILWGVYVKTDPRRKMHSVSMSSDDGLSSQESTIPTQKLMRHPNDDPTNSSYDL